MPVSGPHSVPGAGRVDCDRRPGPARVRNVISGPADHRSAWATLTRPLGFASVLRTAGRAASAPSRWTSHRLGRFACSHSADGPVFGLGSQTRTGCTGPQSRPEERGLAQGRSKRARARARARERRTRAVVCKHRRSAKPSRGGIEWASGTKRSPCTRRATDQEAQAQGSGQESDRSQSSQHRQERSVAARVAQIAEGQPAAAEPQAARPARAKRTGEPVLTGKASGSRERVT